MTGVRANEGPTTLDISFEWHGSEIRCRAGETVATALLCAGVVALRRSPRAAGPRGPFCMMGVCQECLVRIDGIVRQACLTPAGNGMRVESVSAGDEA